jgi:hypothetical protein
MKRIRRRGEEEYRGREGVCTFCSSIALKYSSRSYAEEERKDSVCMCGGGVRVYDRWLVVSGGGSGVGGGGLSVVDKETGAGRGVH